MFVFMRTLGSALSMVLWGRVANRVGFRPMFLGLISIRIVAAPIILFVAPLAAASVTWQSLGGTDLRSVALLLTIGFGTGVVGAGIGIALITLQHFHVDNRDSLEAMNMPLEYRAQDDTHIHHKTDNLADFLTELTKSAR